MVSTLRYMTQEGDTFDMIALDMYNNEYKAGIIAGANPEQAGTIVFPEGVILVIPVIERQPASVLPPWKRE